MAQGGDGPALEQELERLRAVEKHRDWRIAELEKHTHNLEAMIAQARSRAEEVEKHSANLESVLAQARSRVVELERHSANLEEIVGHERHRIAELEAHASNVARLVEQQRQQPKSLLHPDAARAAQKRAAPWPWRESSKAATPVSAHRSRFGGLWPDALDADERLREKLTAGRIGAADAARIEQWRARGIMHLPGAVSDERVDALVRDSRCVFDLGHPQILVEYYEDGEHRVVPAEPRHRDMNVKVLELHAHFESARRVLFAQPILHFLRLLFEDDPLAFQSLYFRLGSEQPMHQDSAYVRVKSPLEMVGVWVALEDVSLDSGPLAYYPGSHLFEEWLWDGQGRAMPGPHADHDAYLQSLHDQAAARGIEAEIFRPKKGGALVWHADLAHGGMPRLDREATRTSLVTHFCPLRTDPAYFDLGEQHSAKLEHETGGRYCYLKARGPGA
jgi:hypothetical protein